MSQPLGPIHPSELSEPKAPPKAQSPVSAAWCFPETAPAPPASSRHNSAVSLQLREFQLWPEREEKCFLLQDAPRSQVKDALMICAPTKVYSHPWQHNGV